MQIMTIFSARPRIAPILEITNFLPLAIYRFGDVNIISFGNFGRIASPNFNNSGMHH